MEIAGEWLPCPDGAVRPFVRIGVVANDGTSYFDYFLIDTGADATVFSRGFFARLRLPTKPAPAGVTVVGIGGASNIVLAEATLEFLSTDGIVARVRGEFACFTDPAAADYSVLGREVLDHFDLIVSRPRNQIRLLAQNHYYQIMTS